MNETKAASAAASDNVSPRSDPAADARAAAGAAVPERRIAANASVPIAILAFLLASVSLVLGVTLLHRTDDVSQRLEQAHGDDLLRDQRSSERELRLSSLEREWRQAQGDGDVSVGAGAVVAGADIRRRREQLAMLDIERLVEQVQLQLRLGAAPAAALDALTAADARLSRLASPAAQRVQTALRHDLARLRAAPDIDRGAVVARLDPLLSAVDQWHASSDPLHPAARPASGTSAGTAVPPLAPAPGAAASATAGAHAPAGGETAAARVRAWLAREFGDFLRIREVDTPEAILLAPAQQQLLRDRFRLGVLDLRQAILARDERAVRAEAGALDALLEHYFDPNQPEVAAAQAQLRLAAAAVMPGATVTLDETLVALHAARAGNDG
jgi:uncharacterized protein HemX